MSPTSLNLLHRELRLAFQSCARQHRSWARSQSASSRQQCRQPDHLARISWFKYTTRSFATGKASAPPRRRLADVERDLMKEHQRIQKSRGYEPGPADGTPDARRISPRVLIYHGRTGKIAMLGFLNVVTMFSFGTACTIVAPAFFASDQPWWAAPFVLACGTIPMLFMRYASFPFVTWAHLVLPRSAQKSAEAALQYSKELPANATLHLGYVRYGLFARRAEVEIGNLVPTTSWTRPISFKNIDPNIKKGPWYKRTPTNFYVTPQSGTGKASTNVVPGVWENVYQRIMNNKSGST